jgi:hypothetical protein
MEYADMVHRRQCDQDVAIQQLQIASIFGNGLASSECDPENDLSGKRTDSAKTRRDATRSVMDVMLELCTE